MKFTEDELIDTYIKHWVNYKNPEIYEETFWAWEELNSIEDAVECLEIVIKIIERSEDPRPISSVAAGKLENLFKYAWNEIKDKSEKALEEKPVLRQTLPMMNIDKKDICFNDWVCLLEKYNLKDQAVI